MTILVLSIIYAEFGQTDFVTALFFGLKPAVTAIVVEAVIRIGKRVLKNWVMVALAAAAFISIFFFELPFPLIILAAGLIGLFGGWLNPGLFHVIKGHAAGHDDDLRPADAAAPLRQQTTIAKTVLVAIVWLAIWFVSLRNSLSDITRIGIWGGVLVFILHG